LLAVVSMLWSNPRYRYGSIYGPDHVNVLHSMVDRYLTIPHKHVCICDNPTGVNKNITVRPIFRDFIHFGGTWTKLMLFSSHLQSILEADRFLYLDLDSVICGSFDELIESEETAFLQFRHTPERGKCSTCLIKMKCGAYPEVWDKFVENPLKVIIKTGKLQLIGWDQAWVSLMVPEMNLWGPQQGILKYGLDVKNFLPDGTRMVRFSGPYDPSKLKEKHAWIKEHWRC